LEVYTIARRKPPRLNAEIVEGFGATYVSTEGMSLDELSRQVGRADLILEATGNSSIAFDSMKVLGHNGVLVWHSVTGGDEHIRIPSDRINIEFVLGNKLLLGSVNANREHFEAGIRDMALGEVTYPGVLQKILTTSVRGLDNYRDVMRLLVEDNQALKVYVEVADE
jgi:threonine dehydrogenase-like Zn-dependent dehydrogenase